MPSFQIWHEVCISVGQESFSGYNLFPLKGDIAILARPKKEVSMGSAVMAGGKTEQVKSKSI